MNNCPNPGPHQNWIHQPSNTYFVLGDFNASYNIFPYEVDPENEIVIKGQYPYARYLSFNIAGEFNLAVISVVDRQLLPDPGSTNPFLPGANWDAKNRQNRKHYQSCELIWSTLGEVSQIFQPEGNTIYIISDQIQRTPGQLLYLRWKAPTFPDTYHNMGIVGDEDMRYWSMSFITPGGLLGLYTISDFQTIIDKKGYVNLVISFGAPRPSSVTSENGFTWVDASQLPLVPLFLFYRNNQASESFPYTAKDLPPGVTVPPDVMGKYYPCGNYVNPDYINSCCWDHDDTDSCCGTNRKKHK